MQRFTVRLTMLKNSARRTTLPRLRLMSDPLLPTGTRAPLTVVVLLPSLAVRRLAPRQKYDELIKDFSACKCPHGLMKNPLSRTSVEFSSLRAFCDFLVLLLFARNLHVFFSLFLFLYQNSFCVFFLLVKLVFLCLLDVDCISGNVSNSFFFCES